VLVPTRAHGYQQFVGGVHVTGPDALGELIARITNARREPDVERTAFLSEDAYRPLPTLVEFVRGVKDYVKRYSKGNAVPPEDVLVFEEAQRAFDIDKARETDKRPRALRARGVHPVRRPHSELVRRRQPAVDAAESRVPTAREARWNS
jgi:hypothetical protein